MKNCKRVFFIVVALLSMLGLASSAVADPKAMDDALRYMEAFPCVGAICTKTARIESADGKTITKFHEDDRLLLTGMRGGYYLLELSDGATAFLKCNSAAVAFNNEMYGTAKKNIRSYSEMAANKKYDLGVIAKGERFPIVGRVGKWYVSYYGDVSMYTLAKDVSMYEPDY